MSDNNLTVYSAKSIIINFPQKNKHISEKDADKTRDLIKNNGVYTPDGRAFINKKALPHLLSTDQKGANRLYNNLDDEDKLEEGEYQAVSVSSVNKEISERIQEPRDSLQKERLRDSEKCINSFRDSPELEKRREIEESKIRKELPKLKKRKMKAENISKCQLTGDELESDADAHHIIRKADNPRLATDVNNVVITNRKTHKEIHNAGAESPEELSELCKKKGWNNPIE